ncbi:protein MAIN-LIKE 1-like [Vicia villosa]|uniref:protein MAIN-LIKE 1-like n=1 Tax=Vicia villosa TaxID=3911 RepID=UPI00273BB0A0|nr:protein MAIN-LIKE 1-like [Vicia villosa]
MSEHFMQEFRFVVRRRGLDGRAVSRTLRRRGVVDDAGLSAPVPQSPQLLDGYPGGPYEQHIARHLWFGEERSLKKELKVAVHRLKLKDRVPHLLPPRMERWVDRSGLTSLQRTSLTKIDTNLVTQFVERWHIEASSFHMSFGEMTITLDDVSCVLHLPIESVLWYLDHVTEDMAVELDIQYLGVDRDVVARHIRECRGAYYSLQWLYDRFGEH